MNLSSIKPQNLIAAAALLTPIALVQTVRLVFGGGPGNASAGVTAPDPSATAAPAPAGAASAAPIVSKQQKSAIEHLNVNRNQITIYTSPFNHLMPRAVTVQQTTPTIEQVPDSAQPVPTVIPPEVRALSLGALMVNDRGSFAVISGRVRSVGEVVVPGWTVTAIDATARRVTITSDEGAAVTLTQSQ